MYYSIPKDPKKAKQVFQRFLAENASIAGPSFSGRRRPKPPVSVQAQGGTGEVLLTWLAPPDPSINGYNIYQDTENNRILTVDSTTGQARIKAKPATPTGYYVSSFNANQESVKVPIIGNPTSDLYVVTGTSGGTSGTSPTVPPGYTYGTGCFNGKVTVKTNFGFIKFGDLPWDFEIENNTGRHPAKLIIHGPAVWKMIDMGEGWLVTPEHPIFDGEAYVTASVRFGDEFPRTDFQGPVFNLSVESEDEKDLHYILGNGYVAHNIRK